MEAKCMGVKWFALYAVLQQLSKWKSAGPWAQRVAREIRSGQAKGESSWRQKMRLSACSAPFFTTFPAVCFLQESIWGRRLCKDGGKEAPCELSLWAIGKGIQSCWACELWTVLWEEPESVWRKRRDTGLWKEPLKTQRCLKGFQLQGWKVPLHLSAQSDLLWALGPAVRELQANEPDAPPWWTWIPTPHAASLHLTTRGHRGLQPPTTYLWCPGRKGCGREGESGEGPQSKLLRERQRGVKDTEFGQCSFKSHLVAVWLGSY